MAGGYSVLNALNKSTREQEEDRAQGRFRTKDIAIQDIYPNSKNFYAMQDIEELAADIEAEGLLENLTVCYEPKDGKNYKLLGGERRWRALTMLAERGLNQFSVATCQVRRPGSANAETIELILCNRQRVKTVYEQIEEEHRLKEALQAMKESGERLKGYDLQNGKIRDVVARILGYSTGKVAKMERIINGLSPEFKAALKAEQINYSTAYTLAQMPPEAQETALNGFAETGSISLKEAQEKAKQQRREEEEPKQPEQSNSYGDNRQIMETICYSCAHWDNCHQKSETTVNCADYENKAQQEKRQAEAITQPQPRTIDAATGEVYEKPTKADRGANRELEQPNKKDGLLYVRVSPDTYDALESGRLPYMILKGNGYHVGDTLALQCFTGGRFTGKELKRCITYMDSEATTSALAEGYIIAGLREDKDERGESAGND